MQCSEGCQGLNKQNISIRVFFFKALPRTRTWHSASGCFSVVLTTGDSRNLQGQEDSDIHFQTTLSAMFSLDPVTAGFRPQYLRQ